MKEAHNAGTGREWELLFGIRTGQKIHPCVTLY